VVNIKDDPEVVMASTSAVNVDEAGQDFGGEDYDESYDGYYEDDGAEMGDGAEGTDGTKGRSDRKSKEHANMTPEMAEHMSKVDGKWICVTCDNTAFRDKTDLRRHVEAKHVALTLRYRCNLCGYCAKTSYYFRKHQLMHEKQDVLRAEPLLGTVDD